MKGNVDLIPQEAAMLFNSIARYYNVIPMRYDVNFMTELNTVIKYVAYEIAIIKNKVFVTFIFNIQKR
jgi:hypothetical protein